jgi:hypothetical protein
MIRNPRARTVGIRMMGAAAALLLVAACSNASPAPPARVQTWQPTPPATPRYVSRTPTPAPAPTRGAFRWHTRIADAQADARATGRLILVGTTKPDCGLCEKFKNQVVPSMAGQVSGTAVGYMLNAPVQGGPPCEAPQIWQALRANLPTVRLMPLVGIFTADLRYVTGFGGPADAGQLSSALAVARRSMPVGAVRPVPEAPPAPAMAWSEAEDLSTTVAPEDALAPEAPVAVEPVLPPAPTAEVVAEAVPAPGTPDVAVDEVPLPGEPAVVAEAPEPEERLIRVPTTPAPLPPGTIPSLEDPVDATPSATAVVEAPSSVDPAPAAAALATLDPVGQVDAWARQALDLAARQIEAGHLDAAKGTLAEIQARLPDTAVEREAGRGTVAVYTAIRAGASTGAERERIVALGRANLARSMWADLFAD